MLLSYRAAFLWATFASLATFFILRHYDPVDLSEHAEKVYGIPPVACCSAILIPIIVLVVYEKTLSMGPKPSLRRR
ncbi:hypothetical protein JKF63_01030 [Porcisia hertigi]|uniref:Uncharacterized protein n=1 Tax=Porcisia hertigi TaxID=2761500 RepID=A0A836HTX7_9TRYP|nr:hypothetical protein JKF63_01030 [Porcisia hertigi]